MGVVMGGGGFLYIENCKIDDVLEVLSFFGETPTSQSRPASDWDDAERFESEWGQYHQFYRRRIVAQYGAWLVLTENYTPVCGVDELFEEEATPFSRLSRRFGALVVLCTTQGTSGWESLHVWRNGVCTRRYEQLEDKVLVDVGTRLDEEPPAGEILGFWGACDVGDKLVGFGIERHEASRYWVFETQTPEDATALQKLKADEALRASERPWWKFW